jgi:hypothetical protein
MILFVGHDPGAKNNLRPLYRHALNLGHAARFHDLSQPGEPRKADEVRAVFLNEAVRLVVSGCSTNREEWPWMAQAKRIGVRTAVLFDVGVGLAPIDLHDCPDRFLVTNVGCAEELKKLRIPAELIRVTGSPHLEGLVSRLELKTQAAAVRQSYGLGPDQALVSLFCPADETSSESWEDMMSGALESLHAVLLKSCLPRWGLVVRPHPRSSQGQIATLARICGDLSDVRVDSGQETETPALLAGSLFSLSLASTVSLESLVLNTPSAFFQMGWSYQAMDALYANVDCVPRLRFPEEFQGFVSGVMANPVRMIPMRRPDYLDATARNWEMIGELLHEQRRAKEHSSSLAKVCTDHIHSET